MNATVLHPIQDMRQGECYAINQRLQQLTSRMLWHLQCHRLNHPCSGSLASIRIAETFNHTADQGVLISTSHAFTAGGFKRIRTAAACDACKSRKDRCTTLDGSDQCAACCRRGLLCQYSAPRKRKAVLLSPPSQTATGTPPSRSSGVDAVTAPVSTEPSTRAAAQKLLNNSASVSYVLSLLSNYFESCHQGLFYG